MFVLTIELFSKHTVPVQISALRTAAPPIGPDFSLQSLCQPKRSDASAQPAEICAAKSAPLLGIRLFGSSGPGVRPTKGSGINRPSSAPFQFWRPCGERPFTNSGCRCLVLTVWRRRRVLVRSSTDSIPCSRGMRRLMAVGTERYEVGVRIISEFAPRPQIVHL